jgi:hypothetical protein
MNNENDDTIIQPRVQFVRPPLRVDALPAEEDNYYDDVTDAEPGELAELTKMVDDKMSEIGDRIHQAALIARFVPTDFEIRESGIYARVRRDNDPGGWWVWRAIIFATREQIIPDVIGIYENRDPALQAAADAVDELLALQEAADTEDLPKQGDTPS